MKKLLIALLIASLALQAACGKKEKSADTNTPEAKPEINFVEASGTVKSKLIKNIIIDFPSYVESVNAEEGQKVKKGDIDIVESGRIQSGHRKQGAAA